jgi:3'-phosphoadenosine 5'-phosphosulfate sulfotransferase (PAPS reductase)/FAD synthetase
MNPYRIEGPALISFSGGRTSAYMLHEILRAHDGKLPPDVHVTFANTGKEREETLRFVHECQVRWNVPVHWVEFRDNEDGFEEVGYNSASRSGEPFAALIAKRGFVPNGVARFCSVTLKVRTMTRFAIDRFGWEHWVNVIGLRYDEGMRIMRALERNDTNKDRFKAVMPLSKARVTVRDVQAFWAAQHFDLGLQSYEGNCDLCFLKSRAKLHRLIRDNPGMADWWTAQEQSVVATATGNGANFRMGEAYESLVEQVRSQPLLPGLLDDGFDHDAECGFACAPYEPAPSQPAPP